MEKTPTALPRPREETHRGRGTTGTPPSRGERLGEEDVQPGRAEMGLGPPHRSGPGAAEQSRRRNREFSVPSLAQWEGDGDPPREWKSQVPSPTLQEGTGDSPGPLLAPHAPERPPPTRSPRGAPAAAARRSPTRADTAKPRGSTKPSLVRSAGAGDGRAAASPGPSSAGRTGGDSHPKAAARSIRRGKGGGRDFGQTPPCPEAPATARPGSVSEERQRPSLHLLRLPPGGTLRPRAAAAPCIKVTETRIAFGEAVLL